MSTPTPITRRLRTFVEDFIDRGAAVRAERRAVEARHAELSTRESVALRAEHRADRALDRKRRLEALEGLLPHYAASIEALESRVHALEAEVFDAEPATAAPVVAPDLIGEDPDVAQLYAGGFSHLYEAPDLDDEPFGHPADPIEGV